MKRWALVLALAVSAAAARSVSAAEACKAEQLKNPEPTLSEIYAMGEKLAKAWKKDVVPARLGNTVLGPLKANGTSASWNLMFYSAEAKTNFMVNTFRGSLTCSTDPQAAARLPDLKADFLRDGAKLYAVAKEHGEKYIGEGYIVMIQTAFNHERHATWNISYSKNYKNAPVTILVDANTGRLEKVIKD